MITLIGVALAVGTFTGIRKLEKLFGSDGSNSVIVEHYPVQSLDLFSRV